MTKPCSRRLLLSTLLAIALAFPAHAQTGPAPGDAIPPAFDSSFQVSEGLSVRLRRSFLDAIRWSVGVEARDKLAESFAERSPTEIWHSLVAADGLQTGNVADALTAYWVLNWVTANGAYEQKVDNGPVRRQLQRALASDPDFLALGDQARQQMAEGYVLNFLLEHAALNDAIARKDIATLRTLAAASTARFQRQMGVNLLALEPGPDGFAPKAP